MAFFKQTRDQLKANALVSHLEFAQQFFQPYNTIRTEHHLKSAEKAFAEVQQAKAEYILSDEGWQYVARLAVELHRALEQGGLTDLAGIARQVGHRALLILVEREDPVSEADWELPVDASEDEKPRVRRDPFFPSSDDPL